MIEQLVTTTEGTPSGNAVRPRRDPDISLRAILRWTGAAVVVAMAGAAFVSVEDVAAHATEKQGNGSGSVSWVEVDRGVQLRAQDWGWGKPIVLIHGWPPDKVAIFAGSIAYLRYHWLMRLIWRRLPLPTDRLSRRSVVPSRNRRI